jgi:5'-3' exonuclease
MRVHVVDGTYELFRNYYGAPPATDRGGREVGAVRGLLRTLASLLREPGVTHVACAFDTVIESFRNDLFAGYKTGEGIDPDLLAQFPLAESATHALGIVVWSMVEFEADDALATAAARWGEKRSVERVVICSPDKDLAQCVRGQRVVLLDRRRGVSLDEPAVLEKFGVPPASIPDWLALVGDDADGIPGISRWGAVSSSAVLRRWGHIGDIPSDPSTWDVEVRGKRALAESLAAARAEAMLYRTLATLRTDVPLREDLEALRWEGVRGEEIETLCAELDFSSFLDTVPAAPRRRQLRRIR